LVPSAPGRRLQPQHSSPFAEWQSSTIPDRYLKNSLLPYVDFDPAMQFSSRVMGVAHVVGTSQEIENASRDTGLGPVLAI